MNTKQIFHALFCNRITEPFFDGVFAADQLEDIALKPQLVVANTHPSTKPGEHWVVFFFHGTTCEYFDSSGNSPTDYNCWKEFCDFIVRFSEKVTVTSRRVQPYNTDICGQLCLFYAYQRCAGYSMSEILEQMENIAQVLKFVEKKLYITKNHKSKFLQKCCCLVKRGKK